LYRLNFFIGKRTRAPPINEQGGCGFSKAPCEIDCEHGHKISSQADKIVGVLIVKKCESKQFAKDSSNSEAVVKKLTTLLNQQLTKKDVKVAQEVKFVKAIGNKTQTQFHYSINAKKEYHDEIKAALGVVCKEKEVNINDLKYICYHIYMLCDSCMRQLMNTNVDHVVLLQVHLIVMKRKVRNQSYVSNSLKVMHFLKIYEKRNILI